MEEDSGLQDTAHVLEEGDVVWHASLALVNLETGLNSYYKLQILQLDTKVLYRYRIRVHVFTRGVNVTAWSRLAGGRVPVPRVGAHGHGPRRVQTRPAAPRRGEWV